MTSPRLPAAAPASSSASPTRSHGRVPHWLAQDQAARLALATLHGAATMAADADVSPAMLADRVASPGGSTREGLNVLDRDDRLVTLLVDTLAASAARNREMAASARQ